MDPKGFKAMMRQMMESMCGAAECSPAAMPHGKPSVDGTATESAASATPKVGNAFEACGCCCAAGAPGTETSTGQKETH